MKRNKTIIAVALAVALILGNVWISWTESFAKMGLNKSSITIKAGQKYSLKLKGTKKKVTWSSSKKKIASVNAKGVVKGKKAGTSIITVKAGKKKFICKVTVKAGEKNTNPASTAKPTESPSASSNKESVSLKKLAEGCTVRVEKMPYTGKLVFTVTNTNKEMVDCINIHYILNNASGDKIDEEIFTLYALTPGTSQLYIFNNKYYNAQLNAETTEIVGKTVEKLDYTVYDLSSMFSSEWEVVDGVGAAGVSGVVKNNSGYRASGITYLCFYSDSGKLIDVCDYNIWRVPLDWSILDYKSVEIGEEQKFFRYIPDEIQGKYATIECKPQFFNIYIGNW